MVGVGASVDMSARGMEGVLQLAGLCCRLVSLSEAQCCRCMVGGSQSGVLAPHAFMTKSKLRTY